jgi:glycosyltransferase involved in cell wall biosynthesis
METNRVSIVIPAFNEGATLGSTLDQLAKLPLNIEIIVVDDGSDDDTTRVVGERSGVRLIRHTYNIGNGAAVKSGIRAARGELIMFMDGDGQHDPNDVPRLVNRLIDGNYDMVVGTRQRHPEIEPHRDAANLLFNAMASYVADAKIPDLTSGFRVMRAKLAKSFVGLLPNGFSSPSTLTLAMLRSGHTVYFEPIVLKKRQSRSKIRVFYDGFRFLSIILRMAVFFSPMRIFVPISLAFLAVGGSYSAYLLIFMHRFSNMAMLFIVVAVLLYMMGLISEQISLLRLMQAENIDHE